MNHSAVYESMANVPRTKDRAQDPGTLRREPRLLGGRDRDYLAYFMPLQQDRPRLALANECPSCSKTHSSNYEPYFSVMAFRRRVRTALTKAA